jgi:uncharacterized phage protein (TIGR01671 family)
MREIKFRCYDITEKTMYYDIQDHNKGYLNFAYYLDNTESFIIEQYTGLKDKNGKEIYEGDIIAYEQMRIFESECFEVIFLEGAFKRKNKNYDLRDLTVFIDKIEIIGNIHENPELIK